MPVVAVHIAFDFRFKRRHRSPACLQIGDLFAGFITLVRADAVMDRIRLKPISNRTTGESAARRMDGRRSDGALSSNARGLKGLGRQSSAPTSNPAMRSVSSPKAFNIRIGRSPCAQTSADRRATFARHHQIQHDQIDLRHLHRRIHRDGIGGSGRVHAVLFQILRQRIADLAVVIALSADVDPG